MAYNKTAWKNREVERPRTFKKVENPDGTITLVPEEGNIIEPGTPIIADNMNNIEKGIEDAHNEINAHKADYIHHAGYGTASDTNSKTITLDPIPSGYKEGMTIAFKNVTQNTGAVTINVNGLGAKSILKSNGQALSSGNLKAGSIYTIRYNGTNFILQGEGGEYGTAQAQDVLSGKTIGTEEGIKNGTMTNRGAINNTITTQGGQISIPQGYHDGSGIVKAQLANLVANNIKSGVNVGGVVGTLEPRDYFYVVPSTTTEVQNINIGFVPSVIIIQGYKGQQETSIFVPFVTSAWQTEITYMNSIIYSSSLSGTTFSFNFRSGVTSPSMRAYR